MPEFVIQTQLLFPFFDFGYKIFCRVSGIDVKMLTDLIDSQTGLDTP